MIPVVTINEMKKIDQAHIAGDFDKSMQLMHKASRGLFDLIISEILKLQKQGQKSRTLILCGAGNNGGDGLLLASHLIEEGYPCTCFSFSPAESFEGESKKALENLLKTKSDSCLFIENTDKLYLVQEHLSYLANSGEHIFIVDALIGIGFQGELREPMKSVTNLINSYNARRTIIAVDSPSGVNNDTGHISQTAPIRANFTLSMGLPKLGSFFYPGRAFYGVTAIHSLGYTQDNLDKNIQSNTFFINQIKNLLPARFINGSKYDHGLGILVAGSTDMQGAAILSTKAALKSGLGMLHVLSESTQIINACPSALVHKLKNSKTEDLEIIDKLKDKAQVIAIGPGLGSSYKDLVQILVKESKLPIILDADGINAFENKTELLKNSQTEILITPHEGEYLRLFPDSFYKNSTPSEKIESVRSNAKELGINILLKGAPNILADSDGKVYIIPYGNSALSSAGSGDVLTGMITGFSAQIFKRPNMIQTNFSKLIHATIIATYLHGKAGEKASVDLTEYCVTAGELVDYLPQVIKESL